ncbi:MAG: hypothetical protein HY367_01820 [Candidatus Aenigmarchaeota archaeon]|nr:hypothetical protein [Candidatus Aenigmarchaeota archaeon]
MKKISILSFLYALPAVASAHTGSYHNYAGLPLLVFLLILIAALALYEFRGKTLYAKVILLFAVLAIFIIQLLFPTMEFFEF